MRSNISFDGMGVIGIIIGLGGIIFAGWQASKTNEITKKLGTSMEEVEKKTAIDIQEAIVNKAVENVAEREAKSAVVEAVNKVRDNLNETISSKVTTAVNENLDAINEAVEAKAQELVDDIDKEKFQKKITEQGAKILSGEFTGSLNGLLAEARSKISYVSNVWGEMMGAVTGRRSSSGNGVTFRLD